MADDTVVSVSIKENLETGRISIETTHPLPPLKHFIDKFTLSEKRLIKINELYDLDYIIARCKNVIPFKRWSDLILEAIVLRETNKEGCTSELKLGGNATTFLAVGDTIYELSPIRVIPPSKAFITTRNQLLGDARLKAEATISSAKFEAQNIIAEGTRNADALVAAAARARNVAEQELEISRAANRRVPPDWLVRAGIPIKMLRESWCIQLSINVSLESFIYEFQSRGLFHRGVWKCDEMEPLHTFMWIPITGNGDFSITSLFMDRSSPMLPHISYDSACLSVDGLPPFLRSKLNREHLIESIERCIKGVTLNSLYVGSKAWLGIFEEIIPPDLVLALKQDDWALSVQRLVIQQGVAAQVNQEQEILETWQTAV